jgi:hypothetical protein
LFLLTRSFVQPETIALPVTVLVNALMAPDRMHPRGRKAHGAPGPPGQSARLIEALNQRIANEEMNHRIGMKLEVEGGLKVDGGA